MPFPFDATLKALVQSRTRDFEEELGLSEAGRGRVLNVDLSTVTAATDIVLGYGEPVRFVVDLNFQASRAADLPARLLLYNGLLHHRFRAPVHSLVVLLRPEADDAGLNGVIRYTGQRRAGLVFRYEVVRLWLRPVRRLLSGAAGVLPLAPLGRLAKGQSLVEQMAAVVRHIDERLTRELSASEAKHLLTATFVLTGLRLSRERALELFEGVRAMRESSTYQYILEEGRTEEARKVVLRLGRKYLGAPRKAIQTAFEGITDLERLERMIDRAADASSWDDLLQTR